MMKNKTNVKKTMSKTLTCVGLVLIAASFVMGGYNITDDCRAGSTANSVEDKIDKEVSNTQNDFYSYDLYKKYPDVEMPVSLIDGHSYIGRVEIPDLDLSLPVMDEWSYPNLKISPCRYSGSVYKKNMVIAAHNYSTHFGNIKNLKQNSNVVFTDMDGNSFVYNVAAIEVLDPTDVDDMKNSGWDLTLFTCNRSGKKRIAVRCMEAEESPAQQN
jgi:sortase A